MDQLLMINFNLIIHNSDNDADSNLWTSSSFSPFNPIEFYLEKKDWALPVDEY